ncbi:type II secretion system F family protein [Candidatus Nomurabacteria bacterium]|nr:type II secretion system F family protein [Candidatus Nomurabacteria bacterium]USN94737.1 MAG: type II secretion system F family protein [Candidatus Nomurabacteria bacterium]
MNFNYEGITKDKGRVKGTIESPDKFNAAKDLREKGITVLSLEPKSEKKGSSILDLLPFGKIKLAEKILFTRNLSGMISAGLSLSRALQVLEKQTENKKMREVLRFLIDEIDKGGTLSDGMAKNPKVFSAIFVSMVRAGEESGALSNALKEVGLNLQKAYDLNKKVKGAMTYPSIILGAIVLVGVLMMIFVVPSITKTFVELGIDLPTSTQFIIFMSELFQNYAIFVFMGLGLVVFGVMYFVKRTPKLKKIFHKIILKIPVIGLIARQVNSARTTRTMSSLLSAGVSVTKALEITKEVLQNTEFKNVIDESIASVQKGVALSEVFKKYPKLYPVMVSEMMEVGEETGNFASMLMDIAVFYEEEVDAKTKNLSTIIEPVLMIFIGGAVGFFALSMITPMYSILDTIG